MKTLITHLVYVLFGSTAWLNCAWAQTYDDGSIGYDSIVEELSSTNEVRTVYSSKDPFANLTIHAGAGYASSIASLNSSFGELEGTLQGSEISFGIDVFSPVWIVEVAFRSFGNTGFKAKGSAQSAIRRQLDSSSVALREFDLRLHHKFLRSRSVDMRITMGLAARYLNHSYTRFSEEEVTTGVGASQTAIVSGSTRTDKYTTPSSIFGGGIDFNFTRVMSLGIDASYRSPLISETIEDGSINIGFKLDGHF